MSATLATNNDQYLFQPIAVATQQGGAEISEGGICPTVTAAAGMSGNNQPWICKPAAAYGISSYDSNSMKSSNPHAGFYEATTSRTLDLNGGNPACHQGGIAIVDQIGGQGEYYQESNVSSTLRSGGLGAIAYCFDARGNGDGETVNTITGDHNNRITDYSSVVTEIYSIDGDKIGKAERAGGSGFGIRDGDKMYTLTAKDTHAVAYSLETFHCTSEEEKTATLKARDYKDPGCVAYWDGSQTCSTLTANNAGGNQRMPDKDNFNCVIEETETSDNHYIVRRLTPTECARLQGFPDRWGDIPQKDTLTDEEYSFWLKVRNTHAAINGRATKEYTKEQLLKWYNKLHSDSSEYKMWGNGIALPNALYVMQGIAEVTSR